MPPRLDTPLLFAGIRGGHLNLRNWRRDDWPALAAAGLDYRKPYAMRHTFVSECIAAGIATFEIARMAGTSVLQIEKTYGHLLPDAIGRGRAALEAFDTRASESEEANVRNPVMKRRCGLTDRLEWVVYVEGCRRSWHAHDDGVLSGRGVTSRGCRGRGRRRSDHAQGS